MSRSLGDRLHTAVQTVKRPDLFCMSGSDRGVNPGLEVEGLGPIGLPLTPAQAAELKAHCQQAPFGKGAVTLVDTRVRKVWQLDPDRVLINNPAWTEFLKDLVVSTQLDLGLEDQKLHAHLYNLLLYEPGGFFLPHRDGEKLDRMVATLVIVLPSAHTGGELVVRHDGRENVIDFGGMNLFSTHYAAFYADCEHEVRPLKSGYRLCLIYNLTLGKAKKPVGAPRSSVQVIAVAKVLKSWPADEAPRKLVVPLDHQYTQDGLTWDALKGVDAAKASVLRRAASATGCRAYLALLTYHISGSADEEYEYDNYRRGRRSKDNSQAGEHTMGEIFDTSLTAEGWADPDGGRPPFGTITIAEEEIVPAEALTRVTPEEEFEGYTGNAGMTLDRWYRHGAIVLWPEANHFETLCNADLPAVITSLQREINTWQKAGAKDDSSRNQCVTFAEMVIRRCADYRINTDMAQRLFDSLLDIDEPDLARGFLRAVVKPSRAIDAVPLVRAACDKYGWEAFQAEVIGLLTATETDRYSQVAGPAVELLDRNLRLLEDICVNPTSRPKDDNQRLVVAGAVAELFTANLEAIDKIIAGGEAWRMGRTDRTPVLRGLTKSLLAILRSDLLGTFHDRALASEKLYPLSAHIGALNDLRPWLRKHVAKPNPVVLRWLAECRRRLEALTDAEPMPPTDFRRDAPGSCKCAECAALRKFLADPTAETWRLRAIQERRSHVESTITQHRCDINTSTEKKGTPHTLVCTKNTASFRIRLKKYHDDSRDLAAIRLMEIEMTG